MIHHELQGGMPQGSVALWRAKNSPYHPRNQSHIFNKEA